MGKNGSTCIHTCMKPVPTVPGVNIKKYFTWVSAKVYALAYSSCSWTKVKSQIFPSNVYVRCWALCLRVLYEVSMLTPFYFYFYFYFLVLLSGSAVPYVRPYIFLH